MAYPVQRGSSNVYAVSSRPSVSPKLLPAELEYVQKLISITPLDAILDRGAGERNCKAIGQEIFDTFKKISHGDSAGGTEAAQRICDAVHFASRDGFLRKQYVERAWDGIGDDNWQWRS